ncbi:hypothetical protein NA78x_000117 [Anatilimnocola sp. NA78]|uniref:hypothetical protein n=1 Tax=Anatilimnocola sp. NA78 TaxID=3415683 RepID=UPI003CE53236
MSMMATTGGVEGQNGNQKVPAGNTCPGGQRFQPKDSADCGKKPLLPTGQDDSKKLN